MDIIRHAFYQERTGRHRRLRLRDFDAHLVLLDVSAGKTVAMPRRRFEDDWDRVFEPTPLLPPAGGPYRLVGRHHPLDPYYD